MKGKEGVGKMLQFVYISIKSSIITMPAELEFS